MQSFQPNLIGLACKQCGKVSSQLRTLGDYIAFSLIYSLITLLLVAVGMATLGEDLHLDWIATIAAILGFAFLPAWWSTRQASVLAAQAPQQDLTVGKKLGYLLVTIAVLATVLGGGLFAYLVWIVEDL